MSADGYSNCPWCKSKGNKEYQEFKKKLEDAYGKVSPQEYIKLVDTLKDIKLKNKDYGEESVKEYYEIGINSLGIFYVSYGGECTNAGCKFKHEFNHKEKL